jgi:hypothetical protein
MRFFLNKMVSLCDNWGNFNKFAKFVIMARVQRVKPVISVDFRTFGEPCSTYETASTKKFQEARTENIGCCTSETLTFCKAMDDVSVTTDSKVELFRNAIARHSAKTREVGLNIINYY